MAFWIYLSPLKTGMITSTVFVITRAYLHLRGVSMTPRQKDNAIEADGFCVTDWQFFCISSWRLVHGGGIVPVGNAFFLWRQNQLGGPVVHILLLRY